MTPYIPSPPVQCVWGWCWLSWGMIQLWQGEEVEEVEVLVQQAAVFFCTITGSIIVLWITSIAGDNRQAAKHSGWHRTPASRRESVWIISRLPADCLWGVWLGAVMCGQGSESFGAVTQSGSQHTRDDFCESQQVTLKLLWRLVYISVKVQLRNGHFWQSEEWFFFLGHSSLAGKRSVSRNCIECEALAFLIAM